MVYLIMKRNKIYCGDILKVLKTFPDNCVNCCITSPPYYGLRNYNVKGQIGNEKSPEEYVNNLVEIFREVRRVLKSTGTFWLNIGDTYANNGWYPNYFKKRKEQRIKTNISGTDLDKYGKNVIKAPRGGEYKIKPKDLIGIPWRVALALQLDGWWLRQDIIWYKFNPMVESVKDRCTKAHEYIFLLTKSQRYYFDQEAIKENSTEPESFTGRRRRNPDKRETGLSHQHPEKATGKKYEKKNKRSVWTVSTYVNKKYCKEHYASFPTKLITPMILAGTKEGETVLDPFMGTGTTAVVAKRIGRDYIGIELNPKYCKMAESRIDRAIYRKKLFDI
jgi:DNA modification methylase